MEQFYLYRLKISNNLKYNLLKLPIFFSEGIQINRSPYAGPFSSYDNNSCRIHRQERGCTSSTLDAMSDSLMVACIKINLVYNSFYVRMIWVGIENGTRRFQSCVIKIV